MNQPTALASKDILVALALFLLCLVASTFREDGNFVPAPVASMTSPKAIEMLCAKGGAPSVHPTRTGPNSGHVCLPQASPAN